MSYHQCYICNKDTDEKKGFLSTGTYIKICALCESKVHDMVKKFPNYKKRFSGKIVGLERYPEHYINRNMMEAIRNVGSDEVIVDYLLGIFNSLKDNFIPGFYQGMIILTNKRLLYFIPKPKIGLGVKIGVMGNRFEYVGSIDDIVEVIIETLKLDGSHLMIRDKGGVLGSFNKIITYEDTINVETFVKSFQKIKSTNSSNKNSEVVTSNDSLSQLKKLKSLLDDGVLTEEEFLQKKTEILSRL